MRICLRFVLQALIIAFAFCALAPAGFAQDAKGPALPPPSLYDESPPSPSGTVAVPVRPTEPVTPSPSAPATTTASQPAPTPAPTAAGQPAATSAPSQPMQTATEVKETSKPWYERLWPFGGNENGTQAQATQPQPAPAPAPGRGTYVPGRSTSTAASSSQQVHTAVSGECLKIGMKGAACPEQTAQPAAAPAPSPTPAPVAAAEPMPAPAPQPSAAVPEPVQVQPLSPEPMKEQRKLETDTPPEPVAAVAPSPPPPAPKTQTTTLAADALFAIGSAELKPAAKKELDKLAAHLHKATYDRVFITGHTDRTGSNQLNERLSLRRAESVKRYLVSKGVPADKLVTEGMGSTMPIVTDKDCSKLASAQRAVCYEPDRRVEIEVSGVRSARN